MMTNLEAARARETEAVAAVARNDHAEAARCFSWAEWQYLKAGDHAKVAEMREALVAACRRRNREEG